MIEVGGVGFRTEVTPRFSAQLSVGDQAFIHTQMVVREDSLTLFGFGTSLEIEMFNMLTTVSGVGPRSALGILATMTPDQVAVAVHSEDDRAFKQVSGIGPKTAKLITVALQGKLDGLAIDVTAGTGITKDVDGPSATVIQALIGLGWPEAVASEAVASASKAGAIADEQALLRASLTLLQHSPNRSSV